MAPRFPPASHPLQHRALPAVFARLRLLDRRAITRPCATMPAPYSLGRGAISDRIRRQGRRRIFAPAYDPRARLSFDPGSGCAGQLTSRAAARRPTTLSLRSRPGGPMAQPATRWSPGRHRHRHRGRPILDAPWRAPSNRRLDRQADVQPRLDSSSNKPDSRSPATTCSAPSN